MGPIEWFKAQETAVQLGVVVLLGFAFVVLLTMLVAGVLIGAAVIGSFVVGVGEETGGDVRADVDVAWDHDAREIRVTYVTGYDDAAELEIHLEETIDAGGTPYQGDELVVLEQVGEQAVFSGAGMTQGDTFHLTVTAYAEDGRSTVVYEETQRL